MERPHDRPGPGGDDMSASLRPSGAKDDAARVRRGSLVPVPPEVLEAEKLPSNRCGDHVLVERVGLGGYGVVFRAWHKPLGRWVALKFLHVGGTTDLQRFEREARLAAQLSHPAIVPIHEVGEYEGRAYLTMQFIEGETLMGARLEPEHAAAVIADVAEAVSHAHERGIIHRDLKPANLMLADGRVYVMDFGLARVLDGEDRLTRTGVVAGTPAYMPPEQATGKSCDARSDVYSLGATLYELLTRHTPFEGHTPVVVLAQVVSADPVTVRRLNPRISRELDAIVSKAMAKRLGDRYATAQAFADDIRRALRGEPIKARAESRLLRAIKWTTRHRLATAFIVMAGVAVSLLVAGSLYHAASMSQARAAADDQRRMAEQKLAASLVAEGDALAASKRWQDARARYEDAQQVLERLGNSSLSAKLGLMAMLEASRPPLQLYRGHRGLVTGVCFLPDGRGMWSVGEDETARLWDVTTGRLVRTLDGHEHGAWSVACSPDGRWVATGAENGAVRLWNADGSALVATMKATAQRVGAVAFSPNSRCLFAGSEDTFMRQWDVPTGRPIRTFAGHSGRVRGIDVSPDGSRVLSAGGDRSAIVWNAATGAIVEKVTPTRPQFVGKFANGGQSFVTAGEDGEMMVWHLSDITNPDVISRHTGVVSAAEFTPGGEHLVTSSWDGRTRVFNWPALSVAREINDPAERVLAMAVSPDGRFVAEAQPDGQLQLLQLQTPKVPPRVYDIAGDFSVDGTIVATWDAQSLQAEVWDVETRTLVRRFPSAHDIFYVSLSPDLRWLLVSSSAPDLTLWDLHTGARAWRLPTTGDAKATIFSRDSQRIWVAQQNGYAMFPVDVRAHAPVFYPLDGPAMHVSLSTDGRVAAFGVAKGTSRAAILVDATTGTLLRTLSLTHRPALDIAYTHDDRALVTATALGEVPLVDVNTQQVLCLLKAPPAPVRSVAVSADDTLIATGAGDGTVRLWDPKTCSEIRTLIHESTRITRVRFTPAGRLLATAHDGSFRVWDPSRGDGHAERERRLDVARRALAEDRADGQALATVADAFAAQGVCKEAVALYDRAVAAGYPPDAPRFGRCLWAVGRTEDARWMLERAANDGQLPRAYVDLLLSAPRASAGPPPGAPYATGPQGEGTAARP